MDADQRKQAILHLLRNVLNLAEDSTPEGALDFAQALDCDAFLQLDTDQITALKYQNENNRPVNLRAAHVAMLRQLQCFLRFVMTKLNNPLETLDHYTQLQSSRYRRYIGVEHLAFVRELYPPDAAEPDPTLSSPDPVTPNVQLLRFERQLRVDPNSFPTLRHDRDFDKWNRETHLLCQAYGLGNILDRSYQPLGLEETQLYARQKAFMMTVWVKTLLTETGKAAIRKHADTCNAQAVYEAVYDKAMQSNSAVHDVNAIFTRLTNMRLTDKWTGPYEDFLLKWNDLVGKYDEMQPAGDALQPTVKLRILRGIISSSPLNETNRIAAFDTQRTGVETTFDQYYKLLLGIAQEHDATRRASSRPRGTLDVQTHHLFEDSSDPHSQDFVDIYNHDPEQWDYIDAYQADAQPVRTRAPPEARLPDELYKLLSDDGRRAWRTIPVDDRIKLMAGIRRTTPASLASPSKSSARPQRRSIMSHDLLLDALDEIIPEDTDQDSAKDDNLKDDDSQAISEITQDLRSVFTANNGSISGTDLRKILSKKKLPRKQGDMQVMTANGRTWYSANHHYIVHYDSPPPLIHRDDHDIDPVPERDIPRVSTTVQTHRVTYDVHERRHGICGALVDRGANGGVAGEDCRIIPSDIPNPRVVDIRGVDNHMTSQIPIVTAGAVVNTQLGPVIAIFHQYAGMQRGATIHSPLQLTHFGHTVHDRHRHESGHRPFIRTIEGYVIPLRYRDGLPRFEQRPYTDDEWDTLPHVVMTSPSTWDPSDLDDADDPDDTFYQHLPPDVPLDVLPNHGPPTDIDNPAYMTPHTVTQAWLQRHLDTSILQVSRVLIISQRQSVPRAPNFDELRPYFLWQSADVVSHTWNHTTQYGSIPMSTHIRRTMRSPNPVFNIPRRNEPIATDTIFSDVKAIDNGCKVAQIFVGCNTRVVDVYCARSSSEFPSLLEECIRQRGAPTRLISDSAKVEISQRVHEILRSLFIQDWQSEPYHQQQNFAEREWQHVKEYCNILLDRTGSPPSYWYLALKYVCFVLNHTARKSLNWRTPLELLLGSTPDISVLLQFAFGQRVYFAAVEPGYPSESKELKGTMVGIADHTGHAMTYLVLTDDTRKVLARSELRPYHHMDRNLRLDPIKGEEYDPTSHSPPEVVQFMREELNQDKANTTPKTPTTSTTAPQDGDAQTNTQHISVPVFDPQSLIGRSILLPPDPNGERKRLRVAEVCPPHEISDAINAQHDVLDNDPKRKEAIELLMKSDRDDYEEVMSYGQLLEHIQREEDDDPPVWHYREIIGHQGPLKKTDPNYKGSMYNVSVLWENGEITSEPLSIIAEDDPVPPALYAEKHGLLDVPGWKRFKPLAKNHKKLVRLANQAKLRSYRTSPKYMYGYEVPIDYEDAKRLDRQNGNTKWADATKLEMTQLDDYATFKDMGPARDTRRRLEEEGFTHIRVHFVYAVKHDGRHKARCVAGGHLTSPPVDSVYSGVVSLRGIRIVTFLAELNDLELWGTDIGNAYLEAETKEHVMITAGPEFGEQRKGHILVIKKALYGLRSSGLRWHEKFAQCLSDLGFEPCKAETDIWMRRNGEVYEYVAVYVDDLLMAMKEPKVFVDKLTDPKGPYKFKLKGTGEVGFHLGCDFFRDDDNTLCMAPRKYIDRMVDGYKSMFGEEPKKTYFSPLEEGDHPELDASPLLDADGVQRYQSLIGSMQWAVSLGRIDIATAVMSMSSFRAAPREGHLKRAKRMIGYLARMKDSAIRFRTDEPDVSDLPVRTFDWEASVYGTSQEEIPSDVPEALGKPVQTITYFDANLYHDWVTGRSVGGILHFLNQTPVDWWTKKLTTVETATYSTEFVTGRIAVDQVVDLRILLRYLGVPIRDRSVMFGDNKSMIDSSTTPHAKLHKRHVALSFHRVRQAVASAIISLHHCPSESNVADLLSKHWSYGKVWPNLLQPLLFWSGDTMDIITGESQGTKTQPKGPK